MLGMYILVNMCIFLSAKTTINPIYKIRHGLWEFLNGLQRLFLDTFRVNQTYFMNNGSMKKVLQKPSLKVTGFWDSISFHGERFSKRDLHAFVLLT